MSRLNKDALIVFKGYRQDGTVFDECEEPYKVRLGAREIMRPIEDALLEMDIDEERTIEISAKDAYGKRREDAIQKAPVSEIPDWQSIPVGEWIMWTFDPDKPAVPAFVRSIENGIIEFDFNHPLAGEDLTYWVKLLEVN